MRGSGQKTARESAPPRASGGRRRLEPTALVPTEVNGDGVEVNGDGVAVNEEQAQFGRLVAFRRQRLGMSQEELAAQMGIGLDGVVRIEQGEAPGPEMSGRLARALRDEPRAASPGSSTSRLRWNGLPAAELEEFGPGSPPSGDAASRAASPSPPCCCCCSTRWSGPLGTTARSRTWIHHRPPSLPWPTTRRRWERPPERRPGRRGRQERLAAERAAAAAAERRREARAAAAARREQEASEVESTPEPPAPVFVPAPSGRGRRQWRGLERSRPETRRRTRPRARGLTLARK